jgi:hypothetical protein
MNAATAGSTPIAKECGGCTMCCKVLTVRELAKPAGKWCAHCKPGQGCGIYAERPQECRRFLCQWTLQSDLGPEWRPDRSKLVLMYDGASRRVLVKCDPGSPQSWRKEPYRAALERLAGQAGPQGGEVIVLVGQDMTVLANGHELHVGPVTEEDSFAVDYDFAGRPIRCRIERPGFVGAPAPGGR